MIVRLCTTIVMSALFLSPIGAEAKKAKCPIDLKKKYQSRLEQAEAIVSGKKSGKIPDLYDLANVVGLYPSCWKNPAAPLERMVAILDIQYKGKANSVWSKGLNQLGYEYMKQKKYKDAARTYEKLVSLIEAKRKSRGGDLYSVASDMERPALGLFRAQWFGKNYAGAESAALTLLAIRKAKLAGGYKYARRVKGTYRTLAKVYEKMGQQAKADEMRRKEKAVKGE